MHQRKLKYRIVESAVCILPDRLFKIPNSNANPANSIFLWSVSRVSWGFNGGSKIESPYLHEKEKPGHNKKGNNKKGDINNNNNKINLSAN